MSGAQDLARKRHSRTPMLLLATLYLACLAVFAEISHRALSAEEAN